MKSGFTGKGDKEISLQVSPKSVGANVKETTLKNGGSHKKGGKK